MKRLFLAAAFVLALPLSVHAEGDATVTVRQISPDSTGTWVLLYSGGTLASDTPGVNPLEHTVRPPSGLMTISVQPPAGATTKIVVLEEGQTIKSVETQQLTFDAQPEMTYRISIQYVFNRYGTIGVTSAPNNMQFIMTGPNGKLHKGRTPKVFKNVPVGQYSLQIKSVTCVRPRPQNRLLKQGERAVIHLEVNCGSSATGQPIKPLNVRRSRINNVEEREKIRADKFRSSAK